MNTPLRWPHLVLAISLATLAVLSACGPGVGGSGTGASLVATTSGDSVGVSAVTDLPSFDLDTWGATATTVCGTSIAGALNCPPAMAQPGTSQLLPTAEGTGPLYFADIASGRQVAVALAGNTLALRRGCPALTFTGLWGQAGSTPARYYGAAAPGGAAALTIDRDTDLAVSVSPNAVTVTLRDRSGAALLGPLSLRPVSAPIAPLPCP
jgi:hypothetical protein